MKRWYLVALLVLILAATAISGCKPKEKSVGELPVVEKVVPQSVEYLTITARCEWDQSTANMVCLLPDGDQTYIGDLINGQAVNGWKLNTIAQGDVDFFVFERAFSK